MNQVEISFNKDKLIPFVFELKSNIDLFMKNGLIETSNECLDYIKLNITRSNNTFKYNCDEGLINLSEQIFIYYFGDDNDSECPLVKYIKELSSLN